VGIPRGAARLLLDEARERPFSGSVLQFGRSFVYFRLDQLERWAREQSVELARVEEIELSHEPELAARDCLSDRTFFRLLGFEEVHSLDVSPWEGAEIVHDLNWPVPEALHGRFDCVFEAGTMQHVFGVPDVFANIHALLRTGGRVIHGMATSNNHVDHGFYMFSPTMFHDYYRANGYRIETELFFEFRPIWIGPQFHSRKWRVYRYEPGAIDHLSYGGFGAHQVGLFVVATKTSTATFDRAPLQSYFRRGWSDAESGVKPPPRTPGARERLEARLARWPPTRMLLLLWKQLRASTVRRFFRHMPPVHRRY